MGAYLSRAILKANMVYPSKYKPHQNSNCFATLFEFVPNKRPRLNTHQAFSCMYTSEICFNQQLRCPLNHSFGTIIYSTSVKNHYQCLWCGRRSNDLHEGQKHYNASQTSFLLQQHKSQSAKATKPMPADVTKQGEMM